MQVPNSVKKTTKISKYGFGTDNLGQSVNDWDKWSEIGTCRTFNCEANVTWRLVEADRRRFQS